MIQKTLDAIVEENNSKQKHTIAVIDIETTGLEERRDFILEIGICELNLVNGQCRKLFDQVVYERGFTEKYQDSWIFYHSTLAFEDVMNASPLQSYQEQIQQILYKYPITAYKSDFDIGFLKSRGFIFSRELADPMILATNVLKIPHPIHVYKYPSAEEAWRYYWPDRPYVEQHRAYDDAMHEALIVFKMYQNKQWPEQ
jgi:DNA polymerase-3 subunit epsilon